MSGCRLALWCLVITAILSLASEGRAQTTAYPTARLENRLGPGYYQDEPLSPSDPGYFQHDLQFFAPADLSEFGSGPSAPVGWYFTYSRLFMSVSGPEDTANATQGQWTWGNRFQLGLMTEKDHGWAAEVFYLNVSRTSFGQLNSVEASKTFRLKPFHYGDIIETFIGPRFVSFTDRSVTLQKVSNKMIGPQIGLRWFWQAGRWKLSAEGRAFALENFQSFTPGTSQDEFVWGGDLRSEAAFVITKDISLVSGWELLAFGSGIGRGDNLAANDQDMIVAGFTFGFEVNR